ncbi:hypothetical protein [Aliivibrio salmonicida]|uniref:hypothetical protein n=1 Tax=Aliivibrio salmonicida TaxID=40269 RepID=UPI003D12AEB6
MNIENVRSMIEWLGVDGVIEGIDKSDLTTTELNDTFSSQLTPPLGKAKRIDIIRHIVNSIRADMLPDSNDLMNMDSEQLEKHFILFKYSKNEVLDILDELEIRPKTQSLKSLINFAVSEIGEIGMFQRIAKGSHSNS